MRSFNIAIDGPAGAGKSTIAKQLAARLEFIYVDTGAMYRAIALYLIRQGVEPQDEQKVNAFCKMAKVEISYQDGEQKVILNGELVNHLLRTEEVGNMASSISVYPLVRQHLLELQRGLAKEQNCIMDGRDIGTCVLPDAQLKIYLTASVETRAKRRFDEILAKGEAGNLAQIQEDIRLRDERDMTRETAPLKQAEDAIFLDSSEMSVEQVIDRILELYQERVNS